MRKFFIIALTLLLSVGTMIAEDYSGSCGTNLTWSLNTTDSTLVITGNGAMNAWSGWTDAPWYNYKSFIRNVHLPNGLTSISKYAFYECSNLIAIEIPNSVTSIGGGAFINCTKLTGEIVIPNGVTRIEGSTFSHCSNLTNVVIPNSVRSIGSEAFTRCYGLTSVEIPSSVISIGLRAFNWCSELTSVHISDLAAWCSITFEDEYSNPLYFATHLFKDGQEIKDLVIPDGVTSIKGYAFDCCYGLTSVEIPNSVKDIEVDAFRGCYYIKNVKFGNNVKSIGDRVFYLCGDLTKIELPSSITNIGKEAFYGCGAVSYISCNAITPPTCGDKPFIDVHKSLPLYVPTESIEAYKTADVWKEFTSILPLVATIEGDYTIQYVDKAGDSLYKEIVTLHVPEAPEINGFKFLKWQASGDLENGIILQAIYTADEPTAAPSEYVNPSNPSQKLIRNENVYILTGDNTYTLQGQKIQ